MKRLLSDLLYPFALFFWIAWYWLVPLGIAALIVLSFLAGLIIGG